jgi:hypothetical protein
LGPKSNLHAANKLLGEKTVPEWHPNLLPASSYELSDSGYIIGQGTRGSLELHHRLISLTPFNIKLTNSLPAPSLPPDSQCGIILHPTFAHVEVLERSMALTKAQIVEALFANNIFTKKESAQILDT